MASRSGPPGTASAGGYDGAMSSCIEVPSQSLSPEALQGLVDEFITREGTDYGEREHSLAEKRSSVLRQLERREVAIVFDFGSESTTILRREELAQLSLSNEDA
jgi:uncharacterized protein YheU (UPF0270 family)